MPRVDETAEERAERERIAEAEAEISPEEEARAAEIEEKLREKVEEAEGAGAALVHRPPPGANSLRMIEATFDTREKRQIAAYLGIDPRDDAFIPYLATCAQYGLDPVMGQIWLMEVKEKGAKDGEEKKRKKPAVGRDGFLAIARRTPEYEGMEFDVVCSKDTFEKRTENGIPRVLHEYPSMPTEFEEGEVAANYRGDIVGAYCIVYVRGKKPTYFFAWLKEHAQTWTSNDGRSGYARAWKYTSVMIIKAAQSIALRLALGITGVVGADELKPESTEPEALTSGTGGGPPSPAAFLSELEVDDELKDRLQREVARANAESPNSWSLAKLQMRLAGRDEDAVLRVLEEVQKENHIREEKATKAAEEEVDAILVGHARDLEPPFLLHTPPDDEHPEGEWLLVQDLLADDEAKTVTFMLSDNTGRDVGLDEEVEYRAAPES